MTALQLARALARRWYITLLGVTLTIGALTMARPETVFWSKLTVTLTQPADPLTPKTLEDKGDDPIAAAAMLMEMVNRGHSTVRSASPDATLYGEGKRDAVSAALRDVGGQWGSQVREPVIDVQAVGHNADDVPTELASQVHILQAHLNQVQDMLHVAPGRRMGLTVEPERPTVWRVEGSPTRAAGSTLLVGAILTIAAVYWAEQWFRRSSHLTSQMRRSKR